MKSDDDNTFMAKTPSTLQKNLVQPKNRQDLKGSSSKTAATIGCPSERDGVDYFAVSSLSSESWFRTERLHANGRAPQTVSPASRKMQLSGDSKKSSGLCGICRRENCEIRIARASFPAPRAA